MVRQKVVQKSLRTGSMVLGCFSKQKETNGHKGKQFINFVCCLEVVEQSNSKLRCLMLVGQISTGERNDAN